MSGLDFIDGVLLGFALGVVGTKAGLLLFIRAARKREDA